LTALGLPPAQQGEGAALVLLSLLHLRPGDPWSAATNPLCGTSPLMDYIGDVYGKRWAPNTRETVRRKAIHQFRDAGLVVANPDKPTRPVNSPQYCYQVPQPALELLRSYGAANWTRRLRRYLVESPALAARYAAERKMALIPLRLGNGVKINLSAGGQNNLIRDVVKRFCPRFTPGGLLLYVGDAGKKLANFDSGALAKLGVEIGPHGKMPDVIVHYRKKNWLVVIEAVTNHGPIDPKRYGELRKVFGSSRAPLVYVTAFLTRKALRRYVSDIAWQTEVWVAESPSHLVHFNGERFLGPYE